MSSKLKEFINVVGKSNAYASHISIPTDLALTAYEFINNRLKAASKGGKTSKRKPKRFAEEPDKTLKNTNF